MSLKPEEEEIDGDDDDEEIQKEKELLKLIRTRRGKLSVLTRKRNEIDELIQTGHSNEVVEPQLATFHAYLDEFMKAQVNVQNVIPEEEREFDHNEWFEPKLLLCKQFIKGVQFWLKADQVPDGNEVVNNGVPHPHPIDQDGHDGQDDIKLGESASKAASKSSSGSSSLNEAMVERAILQAQQETIDEKLALEMEEMQLKAKKEKLQMQTKLAEANAKIKVLSENAPLRTETGSRASTQYMPASVRKILKTPATQQGASRQSPIASTIKNTSLQSETIADVMDRQNDITEMLVKQNAMSQLPQRELSIFHGDPLQFRSFMKTFELTIESKTDDMQQRLLYLGQYTSGDPRKLVRSCMHLPPDQGYKEAKKQLEWHFGNKIKITSAFMDKALKWPSIRAEDAAGLRAYALFLRSCHNTMQEMNYVTDLETPSNLKVIVSKLPFKFRERWRTIACDIHDKQKKVTFPDVLSFIEKQSRIMLDPIFGEIQSPQSKAPEPKGQHKPYSKSTSRGSSFAVVSSPTKKVQTHEPRPPAASAFTKPCMFCSKDHAMESCETFKAKPNKEKIDFLKTNGMCYGCLERFHMSRNCSKRMSCTVCKQAHPTILHIEKKENDPEPVFSMATRSHTGAGVNECALAIVPVQVKVDKGTKIIQTYAFLDQGSSATFCSEELARKLHAPGNKTEIVLKTMLQEKTMSSYRISGLEVAALNSNTFLKLPDVYTQKAIPVTRDNIPKEEDIRKWTYLNEVDLTPIDAGIGLLIGVNAPKAMEPWKIVNSIGNGPYAVKTVLGWVINGPLGTGNRNVKTLYVNRLSISNLENMLTQQYNQDFVEQHYGEKDELSQEDQQFLKIVSDSAELKDGHYHLKLPFRNASVNMPNNKQVAQQRAQHLARRFEKDKVFKEEYQAFMQDVLERGYAEVVPQSELQAETGKVWYVPHHGVYHPRKKKLRVVFDCAAAYGGTSLNKELLQGPDMTNSLLGVLLRFRQGPVAFITDIEGMFHQVRVAKEDVNFLRFLWWPNGDTSNELVEHRMLVHIFGAVSSPSCATYALLRTADDNQNGYSNEIPNTVRKNFYVDDCLKAVRSAEQATHLYEELTEMCLKGGFHLNKWISNDRTVLAAIPEEDRAKDVRTLDLSKEKLPMERALGAQWDVEKDVFTFSMTTKVHQTTRRGILSIVCSIYDPLGFLAPVVLVAKQILQSLCKLKLSWDEKIPPDIAQTWERWLSSLQLLNTFSINRSFIPKDFGDMTSAQLHHFCDASEIGYGAVSYLRLTNGKGEVSVSLVFGKARVAPLKCTTIPRMELAAAVLAVRLDHMLETELQFSLADSIFWTDSMTVLQYIANTSKRFKTYVANRISVIHALSKVEQWRHISSKENPADAASRGLSAKAFLRYKTWVNGPEFLLQQSEWPGARSEVELLSNEDPEVKVEASVHVASIQPPVESCPTTKLLSYFSRWMDLKRAVAWLLKLKNILKKRSEEKKTNDGKKTKDLQSKNAALNVKLRVQRKETKKELPCGLSVEDLDEAESAIVSFVQRQHFAEEISDLCNGKTLRKSSHLQRLDPVMVDGILRVGGRLSMSALPEQAKHPAILPKNSNIAELILHNVHEKVGHSGRNHMLSTLRRQFWIPHANALARRVIRKCMVCRKHHQKPGEQKMSDLPSDRLITDLPPFTRVGMDYFGPIEVKRGRNTVKRYGVIFTCLTCRAVHLEVAHTLDTDSCINAMRRFFSRRGQVQEIRSDNGTNFVSANRELKQALNDLNQERIKNTFAQDGIKWTFNPPHGAHHGGIWERLIQQIKRILCSITKQQVLDDEALSTVFCEVEAICNDRPISPSSDDPNDLEALTPNHLLLLKSKPVLPPGLFSKDDTYGRRRWKQVQYISDLFWKRWAKEYLPIMQQRQKWNKPRRSFAVGDLVLIVDETAPRSSWSMGRIIEAVKDRKGFVRRVRVKTQTNELERPITKVCLLLEAE